MGRFAKPLATVIITLMAVCLLVLPVGSPAHGADAVDKGVTVQFNTPSIVTLGDSVILSLALHTGGGRPFTDIEVEVLLNGAPLDPAVLAFDPPNLGMNDSWHSAPSYLVTEADLPGPLVFTVNIKGDSGSGEFKEPVDISLTETTDVAAIQFIKRVEDGKETTISLGDEVQYSFELSNIGSIPLTEVTVSDPAIGFFVNRGSSPLEPGPGHVTTLTPPRYTPTEDQFDGQDKFINTATVTAVYSTDEFSIPSTIEASDSATVRRTTAEPELDLAVSKTVDNRTPLEGEQVTFTVTVTNLGPEEAQEVRVRDVLPAGLTYADHSTSQGTYNESTGDWFVGGLDDDASATLTLQATVDAGTADTTLTNTARLTGSDPTDSNSANNRASASVTPWLPEEPEADPDPDPEPEPEPEPDPDRPQDDPLSETGESDDDPAAPPLPRTGGNNTLLVAAGLLTLAAGIFLRRRWA